MAEVNADKTEKVDDLRFRYMRARHRFEEKVATVAVARVGCAHTRREAGIRRNLC
jgi:hypothetical protein